MEFNLAQVFSAVAAANPDRDCIVFGDRRFTFAQTDERARRFGRALHSWGLGAHRERPEAWTRSSRDRGPRGPGSMTAAPLMHGAAQWAAFISLCAGRPFVMAPTTTHFDPAEAWALASREPSCRCRLWRRLRAATGGRNRVRRLRLVRAAGAGHRRCHAERPTQVAIRRPAAEPDDPGRGWVVGIRLTDGPGL